MQKCKLAGNIQVYHATAKCRSARICNIIPQTTGDTVNTFSKAIFRIVNSLKMPFSKVFTVYNQYIIIIKEK